MFLPRGEGVAPKWPRPYHYHAYTYYAEVKLNPTAVT